MRGLRGARFWLALGILALVLVPLAVRALAHGASLWALVTFDPVVPAPGRDVAIAVDVLDAYQNPVPGEELLLSLVREGRTRAGVVRLRQVEEGHYEGRLRLGEAGEWTLSLEAHALGARWRGRLPFAVGPEATPVRNSSAVLAHVETTGPGLWIGLASTAALVIGGIAVWWGLYGGGRRPGREESGDT